MTKSKRQTGIWIDTKQAFIIFFGNDSHNTKTISSDIEDFHPLGGSRSKVPYGPMEKISESKYLARRKQQEQRYFEQIEKVIDGSEQVYLFGPAEIKDKLKDHLLNQHNFRNAVIKTESADQMTDPQKIAKAKVFFKL